MNNPIFNAYMNQNANGLLQRVNALKQQMQGNPMDHIQRMLNSGQITQAQYNAAVQKAQQLRNLIGR